MSGTETQVCGDCYYYENVGKDSAECYVHPPDSDGAADRTADVGPIVRKTRRACGDYKRK